MSVQMSSVVLVLAVFYKRATKYVTCLEFQMAFAIRIWKTESQEVLISSLLGNFQRDYHTTCIRLNYSWHLDHSFTCSSHVFMRLIHMKNSKFLMISFETIFKNTHEKVTNSNDNFSLFHDIMRKTLDWSNYIRQL